MRAITLLVLPAALQALAMAVDEGVYHRRRGLPLWERVGHPLDTLTVALCYGVLVAFPPCLVALGAYAGLALSSCLFVTKDEFVHARVCGGAEQWLHAVLFVLHPIVFACLGLVWWTSMAQSVLVVQLLLTLAFGTYQIVYWSLPWSRRSLSPRA